MAKRQTRLDKIGLGEKTLNAIYVKAKITSSPHDYSLKDRMVPIRAVVDYSRLSNVLSEGNAIESELLRRLGISYPAADELRDSPNAIGLNKLDYEFKGLSWDSSDPGFDGNRSVFVRTLCENREGIMYKHNDMIVNEETFAEFAEGFGVKAATALIGLYTRLYAPGNIAPQLPLTLLKSTEGLSLDDVANISFAEKALERGATYVPDVEFIYMLGQTVAQTFYLGNTGCDNPLSPYFIEESSKGDAWAEMLRQNLIEAAMLSCEIFRAFNLMPYEEREALAPALTQAAPCYLDVAYDPNEASFTSPAFDAISAMGAAERFQAIQTYARDCLAKTLPDVYKWDAAGAASHVPPAIPDTVRRICCDLHCKALEDFRVKNFALLLGKCKERGIDIEDMRASAESFSGGSMPGAPLGDEQEPRSFGDMHRGTKYGQDDQQPDDQEGGSPKRRSTPELETMANLIGSCDPRYTVNVSTAKNDLSLKSAYLKLLKPIEFTTKELTKQIREIKTYNTGGKNSGKPRGKLDSHTMYRYKTDPNVFYDTSYKVREMDLAFGIVLDQSGSMYGDGIRNGMVSLIMLHHVLTSLRINHAIVGHSSREFNEVDIRKYVAFNEDPQHSTEPPYMLANLSANDGNCDSGALNYMEQYIKRTRNKDKIVLIFSDGEPSECEESDLKEQIRRMEREGIHVIGLGIDFENVALYYPDNANGRNIAEMVRILVGILKRYVLDKKD